MSPAEVKFGIEVGLIDAWPMVHAHRPAGTWEKEHIGELAKPGPWDGLA